MTTEHERRHFNKKSKQKITAWARSEDWRALGKTEWYRKMDEWRIRSDESTVDEDDDTVRRRMSKFMRRIRYEDKNNVRRGVVRDDDVVARVESVIRVEDVVVRAEVDVGLGAVEDISEDDELEDEELEEISNQLENRMGIRNKTTRNKTIDIDMLEVEDVEKLAEVMEREFEKAMEGEMLEGRESSEEKERADRDLMDWVGNL